MTKIKLNIKTKKVPQLPEIIQLSGNEDIYAVDDTGKNRRFKPSAMADFVGAAQGAVTKTYVDNQDALKVDKEAGKGLSQENYTTGEKSKLAGLESSHFKGLFHTVAALNLAHPSAIDGDYADVDAGVGFDTVRYVWDVSDTSWIKAGSGTPLTASDVKMLYESNPDTNVFDDNAKNKLSGIEDNAEVNNPNTTLQGNIFNGINQLVKLNVNGKLPAIDGSLLTNLPSSGGTWGDLTGSPTDNSDLVSYVGGEVENGDTAFSWGNHADEGYLTSHQSLAGKQDKNVYGEYINTTTFNVGGSAVTLAQDIVYIDVTVVPNLQYRFDGSVLVSIGAAGGGGVWGAVSGSLTDQSDLVSYIGNAVANGNTAFGWGNHTDAGYLTSASSLLWSNVTGMPTTISGYGITDAASFPSQTGNAGKFLTTDGTSASWAAGSGGASIPSQTGNGGKFLKADGSVLIWDTAGGGTSQWTTSGATINYGGDVGIGRSAVAGYRLIVDAGNGRGIAFGSPSTAPGDPTISTNVSGGGFGRIFQRQLYGASNAVFIGDIDANGGKVYFRANGRTTVALDAHGNVGIGGLVADSNPSVYVSANGDVTASKYKLSDLNTAPASATAPGTKGEIGFTSTGVFICVATDSWIKCVGSTF